MIAQGGIASYAWSVTGLPAGLSSTPSGVISGTPTASGTFSINVTATDTTTPQQTASKSLSLTIAPAISISCAPDYPGWAVGVAVNDITCSGAGGTPPYVFSVSAGALPAGLTLNSATGRLTGVLTTAGPYSFRVTVSDSTTPTAQTGNFTYVGTVAPMPTITTASLPNGVINQVYAGATLTAQGGTPPFAWSAAGLPAGMSLSLAGVLSGTPSTAGTFNITVTAKDSSTPQQTATKSLSLTIASGLTITTATLPNGVVNQPYSGFSLQAQGRHDALRLDSERDCLPA